MIALIIAAISDDFENFHNYTPIILGTLPLEFAALHIIIEWWQDRQSRLLLEEVKRRRANGEDPWDRPKFYY